MSTKDNGGPAFPLTCANLGVQTGMTLRDYFAAKAMSLGWKVFDEGYSEEECSTENIAKFSYQMADAMLEERDK